MKKLWKNKKMNFWNWRDKEKKKKKLRKKRKNYWKN